MNEDIEHPPTIGAVSWRFVRLMGHLVAEAVEPHGLVLSELSLLGTVSACPGATNAEIARALDVTPQAANQLVLRLAERGLLAREPHPTVVRGLAATLTAEGHRVLGAASAAVRPAYDRLLAPLTPDEAQTLVDLLQRCSDPTNAAHAPEHQEKS